MDFNCNYYTKTSSDFLNQYTKFDVNLNPRVDLFTDYSRLEVIDKKGGTFFAERGEITRSRTRVSSSAKMLQILLQISDESVMRPLHH